MAEPILLDTHCWVWMHFGMQDRFAEAAHAAVEAAAADDQLLVSPISAWEVGLLVSKQRINLFVDCEQWVREAMSMPGLRLAPLTPSIAVHSTRLPDGFHGDAADRILVATARSEGARLLTKDQRILEYGRHKHVRVLKA